MTDPLPDGWTYFCSRRDKLTSEPAHWYATPPYRVSAEHQREGLLPTVYAATWPALHAAVAEQMEMYRSLMGEAV